MVDHRLEGEAHLADDLGPELQRVAGVLPARQRQFRPHRSSVAHQKKWKRESGQMIMTTLPTIDEPLTGPHMRLSQDRVRLSPITK